MSVKRESLADIFSLISFGFIIGMAVELFVAGLSIDQSLQSRLMSIPVNMVIARPYGIYRDWLLAWGGAAQGGFLRSTVLDILAFISFQMPVYAMLVAGTGASREQIVTACVGQIGALVLMARPYGMWMQVCRNWFTAGSLRTA
ncbi:L-alanine exporter AlaE [Endozoicomonadaceae bacterium StTr2]